MPGVLNEKADKLSRSGNDDIEWGLNGDVFEKNEIDKSGNGDKFVCFST